MSDCDSQPPKVLTTKGSWFPMRLTKMTTLVVCSLLALGGGAFASPAQGDDLTRQVTIQPENRLDGVQITQRTAKVFSGTSTNSAVPVDFTATQNAADRVDVRLVVDKTTVKVSRNLKTGTSTWGAGGESLSLEEVDAVQSVYEDLVPQWREAVQSGEGVDGKVDLTVRLLALVSEAPPGLPLTDTVMNRPKVSVLEDSQAGHPSPGLSLESSMEACVGAAQAATVLGYTDPEARVAACQVSNHNGVTYFPCSNAWRYLNHDAANHCFSSTQSYSGPGSTDCMAECGPGCNGLNFFTQDCGDHDQCGRHHGGNLNPIDGECGDEYYEAVDDFVWGWPKCW